LDYTDNNPCTGKRSHSGFVGKQMRQTDAAAAIFRLNTFTELLQQHRPQSGAGLRPVSSLLLLH